MHVGVAMFCTDYAIAPTELAAALEQRGFESLWLPEHSHIPLSRLSPYPAGGELPKKYYDVMDPFVVLGAAAAVTTRLQLATGICLVPQRDPIQTAKSVATIDQLSQGRFLFGVGAGWNADEMADHGTDFKRRNEVLRERIEAMRAIWTQSKPSYHGEFVKFGPMMTWPKPGQKPHPPACPTALAGRWRMARDGCLTHAGRPITCSTSCRSFTRWKRRPAAPCRSPLSARSTIQPCGWPIGTQASSASFSASTQRQPT